MHDKALRIVVIITLVFACCQAPISVQSGARYHTISGTLQTQPTNPAFKYYEYNVFVEGSNLSARVDTAGLFTIFAVPSGTYLLHVRNVYAAADAADTMIILQDDDSSFIQLDRIVFPPTSNSYSSTLGFVDSNGLVTTLRPQVEARLCIPRLKGRILFTPSFGVTPGAISASILVTLNGINLPLSEAVQTGIMGTPLVSFSGCDTLIAVCSDTNYRFTLLDSMHLEKDPFKYLYITTGACIFAVTGRRPTSGYYYRTDTNFVTLSYSTNGFIDDLDLLLVDAQRDSCNLNRHILGQIGYTEKKIVPYKDTIKYSSTHIASNLAQNGNFSVYVTFVTGWSDTSSIYPITNIALGAPLISPLHEISKFYSIQSVRPVSKGQTVKVATFSIPGFSLIVADSMSIISRQSL